MGTTLTNQNFIQEEIKSKLKSENACYHSVQNFLSYILPSKKLKIKIHRTLTLPVVVYGCETWSLKFRKISRLKMFKDRVLRSIFGPKRVEVAGEWSKLRNEELNDLYSPTIIRAGHVACAGERRGVYRVLVEKYVEKRPVGRPWCRWDDDIKIDRQGVGWGARTGLSVSG